MQNPNSPLATEYKVRPVVRYLITRYEPFWSHEPGCGGMNGSQKFCEVESEAAAEELARLLNDGEAQRVAGVMVQPFSSQSLAEKAMQAAQDCAVLAAEAGYASGSNRMNSAATVV